MVYLMFFIVSIIFMLIGFKFKSKFFVFIGLIIPCICAGLRDVSVGTDTGGYVFNTYNVVYYSSGFKDYLNRVYVWYLITDYLYLIINYLVAKYVFFNPFQIILFTHQLLTIFPLYYGLKNFYGENNKKIIIGIFMFYLTMFNLSLNIVRQCIAISFFILSFSYYYKNVKSKKAIFYFIVAYFFHNTIFATIPIYLLYYMFSKEFTKEKFKSFVIIMCTFILSFFLLFYRQLIYFISASGIYPKAVLYLERYAQSVDFSYMGTLLNIVLLLSILFNKKRFNMNGIDYKFGVCISIFNILFSLLGMFIKYTDRLAFYYMFLIIGMYMPAIFNNKKKNSLFLLFIILFFILYWVWIILLNNTNATLPYKMFI